MVIEELDNREKCDTETMCFDRYKMFLKQYKEWVDANKDKVCFNRYFHLM